MEEIKNNKYDFILNLFTSFGDRLRPIMSRPSQIEDMVYATDAHSVVRVKKNLPNQDYSVNKLYPDTKFPNAKKVYDGLQIDVFQDLETTEFIKEFYNSKLRLDRQIEECEQCDGYGECECECCGNEGDCKKCDGTGEKSSHQIPEITLDGKDISFLGKKFNPALLYKVVHTCLLLDEKTIKVGIGEGRRGVLFIVGDIEIIIMPKM